MSENETIQRNHLNRCFYLIKNAMPIMTSSIGLMLMSITDTIVIARLGNHALAAQGLASVISMAFFMGLAAFIFPMGNLIHLNQKAAKSYLKAGLIILWVLAFFVTILYWVSSGYIEKMLLPEPARGLFHEYFAWSSLRVIPGVTFFYLRMLIYTLDNPIQITSHMALAFFANLFMDIIIYLSFNNPLIVMFLIAIWTAFLFLVLAQLINNKLPKDIRLFNILFEPKWNISAAITVCKTCVPSMLTSFFEFLFFCVIGVIVARTAFDQLAIYRVVVQVEELLVLFFYSLTVVISVELSKSIGSNTKRYFYMDSILFSLIVFLASLLLFIVYPVIASVYGLYQLHDNSLLKILAPVLLISECLMLLSLSYLRALAKNRQILTIIVCINWLVLVPLALLLKMNNIFEFIGLIICGYLLISFVTFVFFRVKNYPVLQIIPGGK